MPVQASWMPVQTSWMLVQASGMHVQIIRRAFHLRDPCLGLCFCNAYSDLRNAWKAFEIHVEAIKWVLQDTVQASEIPVQDSGMPVQASGTHMFR